METQTSTLIHEFIQRIWNKQDWTALNDLLHDSFTDHSIPRALGSGKEALKKWIAATSASFRHKTIIEEMICAGDKCFIRITVELEHTGPWRNIPATGATIKTHGYRLFRIRDGKISEQWGLLDAMQIENQLKQSIAA